MGCDGASRLVYHQVAQNTGLKANLCLALPVYFLFFFLFFSFVLFFPQNHCIVSPKARIGPLLYYMESY